MCSECTAGPFGRSHIKELGYLVVALAVLILAVYSALGTYAGAFAHPLRSIAFLIALLALLVCAGLVLNGTQRLRGKGSHPPAAKRIP